MSGPIVRKYGFPNHDRIFGKKEIQHGVEETPSDRLGASQLTPDLPDDSKPLDPNAPEAGGTIAPSTEFGQSGG